MNPDMDPYPEKLYGYGFESGSATLIASIF
jgi:hypothetical protein